MSPRYSTASLLSGLQYFADQVGIGYTAAWGYFANLTGNVDLFATASHDVPIKVVVDEYGIGLVIDYYEAEEILAGEPVGYFVGTTSVISPNPAGNHRWCNKSRRRKAIHGLHHQFERTDKG